MRASDVAGPLLKGQNYPPGAAAKPDERCGVISASVGALLLSLGRLDAGCGGCVSPAGYLHHMAGHAVEVAGVVGTPGAQLAADRQAQDLGEVRSGFKLCAVALGLLGVAHVFPPHFVRRWPATSSIRIRE